MPLVSPQQLRERLAGAGLLILDARPLEDYEAGHVPGARHLDTYDYLVEASDPAALEEMRAHLAQLFASAGVSGDEEVVLYDETGGMRAARSVWFLQYLGHPSRPLPGWRFAGLAGRRRRRLAGRARSAATCRLRRAAAARCPGTLRLRRRPPEPARRDHPRHPQRGRAQGRGNSRLRPPRRAFPAPSGWSGGASSTPKDASQIASGPGPSGEGRRHP